MTPKQKLLFLGIVLLTIFFRFYLITQMPGGLFPDEAANGLDINSMQQGDLQPFYERGNGREALFFYMLWGSVELFGKGDWQHHIISALVGTLAVIITFFLTRRLVLMTDENGNKERATWIALTAMFIMAVSTWHVVLSRTAFRANLIPLFTTLTLYFLVATWRAQEKAKRNILAILTAISFALGFYTYIAYRILVPLLIILLLWPIAVDFFKHRLANVKRFILPALLGLIAFVIFIYPLAHYFYTHPGSFVGRSGQVSVFNPELNQGNLYGTIAEVAGLSIQAYFTEGDLNWRHNISGQPFLSIIISPFFAIGLIIVVLRATRYTFLPHKYTRDWPYFLLAGWFVAMLLPVITTAEGIPHGLRAIGTIPAVFIISAFGIFAVKEFAQKIGHPYMLRISEWKQKLINNAVLVMYIAFVIALPTQAYALYFIQAYNTPENFYAFRADLSVVGDYLNEQAEKGLINKSNTYLILDKFSVQTIDYVTSVDGAHPDNPKNQPYTQVDPENSWELENLKPGDQLIFTQSSIFDIKKFKSYHPEAHLFREDRNKFNQTVMAIYLVK